MKRRNLSIIIVSQLVFSTFIAAHRPLSVLNSIKNSTHFLIRAAYIEIKIMTTIFRHCHNYSKQIRPIWRCCSHQPSELYVANTKPEITGNLLHCFKALLKKANHRQTIASGFQGWARCCQLVAFAFRPKYTTSFGPHSHCLPACDQGPLKCNWSILGGLQMDYKQQPKPTPKSWPLPTESALIRYLFIDMTSNQNQNGYI